jgi:hypothetical protein
MIKDKEAEPKGIKEIKEVEGLALPGTLADPDVVRRLTDRIDRLERQIASATAFIRPEERPPVGKKVFKEDKEQK